MTNKETDPNQMTMPLPLEGVGILFQELTYSALKNTWEFTWTQKLWVQHPPLPSPYFLTTVEVKQAHLGFRFLVIIGNYFPF